MLKTLKDINLCSDESSSLCVEENLKKEAINWIQQFKKEGSEDANKNAIDFIEIFFNITKEDLK